MPSTAARARFAGVVFARPEAVDRSGGVGTVRGAFALEVRDQHQTLRTGRG